MTRRAWIFINIICSFAAGVVGVVVVLVIFSMSGYAFMVPSSPTTKPESLITDTTKESTSTELVVQTTEGISVMSAKELLDQLVASGIVVNDVIEFDEETDPNDLLGRPGQYASKVNFSCNEEDEQSSSIEVFENEADAKARFDYVVAVTSGASMFAEYDYLSGVYFLRIYHSVLPSDAEQIESAFLGIVDK